MIRPESFFIRPSVISSPKVIHNIDGLFTREHNLGTISEPVDSLAYARLYYRNYACDQPVFLKQVNGNYYVSRNLFYSPVVRSFISKQVTFHETIYRWNSVSPTGILLQSMIING